MEAPTLKNTAAKIAKPKLAKIPAIETNSSPILKFEKFRGLTGTGLAQPMANWPEVETNISIGSRIEPSGSIWGIGFKVSLPATSAVRSPNFKATSPCMTSWTITENKRMTIDKARISGLNVLIF